MYTASFTVQEFDADKFLVCWEWNYQITNKKQVDNAMCFAWNALFDYVSNAYQYLNYM